MSAATAKKNWFVDLPVASKMRVLTVAHNIATLSVSLVSAATLIAFDAPISIVALPLVVAALSITYSLFAGRYDHIDCSGP